MILPGCYLSARARRVVSQESTAVLTVLRVGPAVDSCDPADAALRGAP